MKVIFYENDVQIEFYFRKLDFEISRDQHDNWDIFVKDQSGCNLYNGTWENSSLNTMKDAIIEACHGSKIEPPKRWGWLDKLNPQNLEI